MPTGKPIRVLIVDDSAFMCKVLESIIGADPDMEVAGVARDGREAIAQSEALNPDVITMDISMPHVDGLQATEVIMATRPRPILIVSSESREGAAPTLRALELGAIDFVPKPSNAIDLDMNSIREELCRKLKMAAKVRVVRTIARSPLAQGIAGESAPRAATPVAEAFGRDSSPALQIPLAPAASSPAWNAPAASAGPRTRPNVRFPIVCLAASTGGPATLMQLAPSFPANFPASVLLVQHMPGTFTSQFVEQLAEVAAVRVKEAESGELIVPGTIYVCPGSHHLRVSPTGRITLDDGPRVSGYRPCADLTLETLASFAGPMSTAVVLTGMGSDGTRGATLIKAAGGHVIAQDEATSVIYGMPGEAVRAGAVDQVLPIEQIYHAIERRVLYALGAARVGAL
jgi:two-component system chemotaxis response regulator CheB